MWISDIESRVLTRIKVNVTKKLKSKYSDIFFTTSDRTQDNPKFPTILIRDMGSGERGNDLENSAVNSYQCTIQIDVIDNISQNRAKDVMESIVNEMKKLRFSIISAPRMDNTSDTFRSVARFRRTIDWNDIL